MANYNPPYSEPDEIDENDVDTFCCYLLQHLLDVQSCGTADTIAGVLDEYCAEVDPSNYFNYIIPRPGIPGDYRFAVQTWVREEVLIRQNFFLYPAYRSLVPYHL